MKKRKLKVAVATLSLSLLTSVVAFATESGSTTFTKAGQHGAEKVLEAGYHRINVSSSNGKKYSLDMKEQKNNAYDPNLVRISNVTSGTSAGVYTKNANHYIEAQSGASGFSVTAKIAH